MRGLADRVVLVVGGGADGPVGSGAESELPMGNGRAIALRLSEEGARIAVTDIAQDRAEATVAAMPGEGVAIVSDAGDPESCRAAVASTEAALGPVDIVVCNVAVNGREPLRAQSLDDWQRTMDINATGHWVTAQAALPSMLERGRGTFVFIGSTGGVQASGSSLAYEASKAAQLAVMRHIAVRYAARGVRANAVVLGIIDSTMVRRMYGDDDRAAAARGLVSPMHRQGRPEETAAAAAFLASEESSYVNGHCLVVDGGVSAEWPRPALQTTEGSES